jgi:hypothetical protein
MVRRSLWTLRVALLAAVIFGGFLATSTPAHAQGWLAGAAVGQAKFKDYSVGGAVGSLDDKDTGYVAFGGYDFKYYGAVLAYVDLGTLKASGPAFGGFTDRIKSHGFYLGALGVLPVHDRVAAFATTGAFRWNQTVDYADAEGPLHYDESGTSLAFGAGVNVDLTAAHTLGLHLEWMMFKNVGDNDNSGHRNDRMWLAVGVIYHTPRP